MPQHVVNIVGGWREVGLSTCYIGVRFGRRLRQIKWEIEVQLFIFEWVIVMGLYDLGGANGKNF